MLTLTNNNGILEMPMEPKYEPDPRGFGAHCFYKMKEFSDKIAQIDYEKNKSETYGEILISSIRVALKIKSLGITDEDIVSLCTGTHSETCLPFWAGIFMGAQFASLDPILGINDLKYLINLTKPKLIFCDSGCVENLEIVMNELKLDIILVVFGETQKHITFNECLKPQTGEEEFQPKFAENMFDTISILYSSGTTGLPKGVCITHYGMLYKINLMKDYFDCKSILFYSSPYWISYILLTSAALISGGQRILSKFDEKNILKIIQDYKVTFLFLPPSFSYVITTHPDNYNKHFDTSSLTSIMIGGACIGNDQISKIRKLFTKCSVCQVYGLTEVTGLFSGFHYKNEPELVISRATSCGKMLPDTMCKIVDIETNKILGPNTPGELLVKSKRVMSGYYNDLEKTADAFDEDGFLHTGDVLYYDEDYCFHVVDRIKEMFKYRSWQIAPSELEDVLLKHPAVKEVQVIGYPDEVDGDHPMAVIVPNNGVDVSENDILQYFNDQVIDCKRLRGGVKFIKNLPRTTTGKYSRRILRSMVINNEI